MDFGLCAHKLLASPAKYGQVDTKGGSYCLVCGPLPILTCREYGVKEGFPFAIILRFPCERSKPQEQNVKNRKGKERTLSKLKEGLGGSFQVVLKERTLGGAE